MDLFFNHPGKLMLALFIEAFRKNDNQRVTIRSMLHKVIQIFINQITLV